MSQRKAKTAQAILDAAERAFAERGVAATTIEEIARDADVAVGSVYNHFGSKDGLQMAVADRALEADERFMDVAYAEGRSPADSIRAAADEFLRFYLEHPEHFRQLAFPQEMGHDVSRAVADRIASRVQAQNDRLADALRRGIAEGAVRPVDPERVAQVLWSAWTGIIALAWRPDALGVDVAELRRLLEAAAEVVTLGLVPRD